MANIQGYNITIKAIIQGLLCKYLTTIEGYAGKTGYSGDTGGLSAFFLGFLGTASPE